MSRFSFIRPVTLLALALLATTLSASAAAPSTAGMRSTSYSLGWSALGEVSGGASTSVNFRMHATVGQMAAGTLAVGNGFRVCSGFECAQDEAAPRPRTHSYLPVLSR